MHCQTFIQNSLHGLTAFITLYQTTTNSKDLSYKIFLHQLSNVLKQVPFFHQAQGSKPFEGLRVLWDKDLTLFLLFILKEGRSESFKPCVSLKFLRAAPNILFVKQTRTQWSSEFRLAYSSITRISGSCIFSCIVYKWVCSRHGGDFLAG